MGFIFIYYLFIYRYCQPIVGLLQEWKGTRHFDYRKKKKTYSEMQTQNTLGECNLEATITCATNTGDNMVHFWPGHLARTCVPFTILRKSFIDDVLTAASVNIFHCFIALGKKLYLKQSLRTLGGGIYML